jgi:hypothetical protein
MASRSEAEASHLHGMKPRALARGVFIFLAVSAISFMGTFLIFGPKKQTLYDRLKKNGRIQGLTLTFPSRRS